MNAAQSKALWTLRDKHPGHDYKEQNWPAHVLVSCSCKRWRQQFPRTMNAMARVSKQMAAYRKHLESLTSNRNEEGERE